MAAYEDELPYYQTQTPQEPPKQSKPAPLKVIQSSSGLFADAIKEGWVLKKGPQTLAGWKKRFLQLTGNKQLGYYTDESMVQKKGTIFLSGLNIHDIKRSSKTSDSKHHGFCVVTDKRTFQFCVANSTDRDHWIQKIREVIDEKWDAHKIEKPSISYTASQRERQIQQQQQRNNGKVNINGNNNKYNNYNNNNNNKKKANFGYNNSAYDDWDDDDDDDPYGMTSNRTLNIKNNILKDQQNNNNMNMNMNMNNSAKNSYDDYGNNNDDNEEDDRFAHRSKYKRRNQQNQIQISEQEAKEQIQQLEEANAGILDEAIQTTYETQAIAADTAQKLDDQRHQLINIDKNLHEIDQDLDKTEGILDGMKSWGGMIKRKFKKKDQPKDAYQAPVANKSTFDRNNNKRSYDNDDNNNNNGNKQLSQYEADNVQDEKLDELLKNMKQLNATANDINNELDEQDVIIDAISEKMDKVAPRMQQQVTTMKKIT